MSVADIDINCYYTIRGLRGEIIINEWLQYNREHGY